MLWLCVCGRGKRETQYTRIVMLKNFTKTWDDSAMKE